MPTGAGVAQLVEQWTENPRVPSSILGPGTILSKGEEEQMAVITLNEENFDKEVLQSDIPVLVDFWATWCAPCRMIAPVVDAIAEEYEGRLKVGKVNVDESSSLAIRYGIRAIPTLILFKDGKVVEQLVGVQPKDTIKSIIEKHLG